MAACSCFHERRRTRGTRHTIILCFFIVMNGDFAGFCTSGDFIDRSQHHQDCVVEDELRGQRVVRHIIV